MTQGFPPTLCSILLLQQWTLLTRSKLQLWYGMQMIHKNKIMEVHHRILTDKSGSSAASIAVRWYFGRTAFAYLTLTAHHDKCQTPPVDGTGATTCALGAHLSCFPFTTCRPWSTMRLRHRTRTLRDPLCCSQPAYAGVLVRTRGRLEASRWSSHRSSAATHCDRPLG